jgi:hypothetical protein
VQVVAELLLGLVFCMWAALTVPGKFLSILPHSEQNRYCYTFLSVSSNFFELDLRLEIKRFCFILMEGFVSGRLIETYDS